MSKELEEISILDHLDELRKRILICVAFIIIFSIIAYINSEEITSLLKAPLGDIELIFITPVEGFVTKLMIAVFGGMVLSSPIIFLQTLLFVSPAMNKKEKIIIFISLPFVVGLFFGGIYFCFTFILPTTLKYLMSFGNDQMKPMLSVGKYFYFVILLTLAIGAVFELPMILLLLTKMGIVSYEMLVKKRKYVLLMIVIVTAVLTPTPDAVTLLAVALPLILLFEITLGVMYVHNKITRKKKKKNEKYL